MIRAYGMRGLFGAIFSRGIDEFATHLESVVETVDVRSFKQGDAIRYDIEDRHKDTKLILFGHSMGANVATEIAKQTNKRIQLLIAFDPTIWWPVQPIGGNVDRALCFYGRGASLVGRAKLVAGPGSQAHVTNIPTYQLHTSIDDDEGFHSMAMDAVRRLVSKPIITEETS